MIYIYIYIGKYVNKVNYKILHRPALQLPHRGVILQNPSRHGGSPMLFFLPAICLGLFYIFKFKRTLLYGTVCLT